MEGFCWEGFSSGGILQETFSCGGILLQSHYLDSSRCLVFFMDTVWILFWDIEK